MSLLFSAVIPALWWVLVIIACGTAAALGGSAGRWTALLYISAAFATFLAGYIDWDWTKPNATVFVIDTALLVGLYTVALGSRRYWPLWLTGLHLLTVCAHLSAMIAPHFLVAVYFVLEAGWSLPKLGVLVIGVLLDWRRDHDRRANLAAPSREPRRDRPRTGPGA